MEYKSLKGFYWFGTCLRYLQDARAGRRVHGDSFVLYNTQRLFKHLDEFKLVVTSRVAHSMLDSIVTKLKAKGPEERLTVAEARELSDAISKLRATLEAEIQDVGAYTPTPKRLDLRRLLHEVPSLFAPDVHAALPPIARFDFDEAGKCIAFERATAAAFHILRATEDVLRFYYRRMVRHGRISNLMWGPIVQDLAKHQLTRKYETLNNHLDNIRVSFRNPTQHPEATYDIHEVQDLWSVCVEVVNRMIKALGTENRL